MKTEVKNLNNRINQLESNQEPETLNLRRVLRTGLPYLPENEQISLTRLIRDIEKENINSGDFEAWLSNRPPDQQTVARKVIDSEN